MKEEFLYHVWQNAIFDKADLLTTQGDMLQVLTLGIRNTNAGPDFFNARIQIGETVWAGNIEIHVKASDWQLHGHQHDKAYDSVVLHVVAECDTHICRSSGELIPTLILPIPDALYKQYCALLEQDTPIRCANRFSKIDEFTRNFWLEKMLIERLEQRSADIDRLFAISKQSWEETLYLYLARSFGFGLNADAFEQLARSLPLLVLAKHKSTVLQIEALLFGQSGLLQQSIQQDTDEYTRLLMREYSVLRSKYSLVAMNAEQWKFLRLRPANFPTIRIAEFAALIHRSSALFSRIRETESLDVLLDLFSCSPSDYWKEHYVFGKQSEERPKTMGRDARRLIIINAVIPILFVWAQKNDNHAMHDRVLRFLDQLEGDNNSIIAEWRALKIDASSAAQTQALLHVYQHYCQKGACLQCDIGRKLIHRSMID